ncbi:MAG: peptidylprolyl isomerase [Anaerolineales bacterium]|nr:peptidylprolyl isomerase [Anaerolineales bacterium]
MNQKNEQLLVADDLVISMDYELTVDGEVVDGSDDEPIQFLQGHGNIIAGLEEQIYGMAIGESRKITVTAENGYGDFDPEQVVEMPRDEFPKEIPLEAGVELEMKDEDGDLLIARITEVEDDFVVLDFNHPLAGQDLHFEVTVVDIRAATDEELEHGHVHGSEGHAH